MAHLIRSISGTNREPIYGFWRNCDDCRNSDPAETVVLDKVLAETPQVVGMTLAEFWEAFTAEKLAAEIHPKS